MLFSKGRSVDLPLTQVPQTAGLPRLRSLGLSGRCFCLEHLNLSLGLALRGFAALPGLLQLRLYLRVELVDLLLEFCFAVGMGLGVFSLELRQVCLHGSDVLVVNGVFYVRERAPENGSADRFH